MATRTLANLTAVISANNTKFNKGINGAKSSLSGFKKTINTIGPAIVASFGVAAIKRFASTSLRLYDTQIKAEKQLLTALKGRSVAQQNLINQAQELQKTTLFGDEETIRAQSLIAAFVKEGDQIERIIPLVQDLATAKNMDLAAAADLVSKTLGSSTNALARYGIQVEGTVGSVERLESLMGGLSEAFGGQAVAAAQADKVFTQLKNTFGDFQENLAGFVTQADRFGPLDVLQEDLQNISAFLDKNTNKSLKEAQKQAEGFMKSLGDKTPEQQLKAIAEQTEELNRQVRVGRDQYKKQGEQAEQTRGKAKRLYKELQDQSFTSIEIALRYIDILKQEAAAIDATVKPLNNKAEAIKGVTEKLNESEMQVEDWMTQLFNPDIDDPLEVEDWMTELVNTTEGAWYQIGKSAQEGSEIFVNSMADIKDESKNSLN